MIRIVIDTNVFVSSFFGGNPKKVIDLWKDGKIVWCLSNEIVDEYVAVLRRMGLQNEKEIQELLKIFAEGHHIAFTTETPHLEIIKDDPADNKFLECTVALDAAYIVSGDKYLKQIKQYLHITIANPKEFLDAMKREEKER